MITLNNEELLLNHEKYISMYKQSKGALLQSKFFNKTYPILEERMSHTYPREIKIPKDFNSMLKGDLSPEYIIKLNEPMSTKYGPAWFGYSSDGVAMRMGYIKGDSRYPLNIKLDDATIHMVLVGSTGQGKSVTLNSFIYGACQEYGPWDVQFILIDPKLVELKPYALDNYMPHIRSVAATSDADYIVSSLENCYKEMLMFNSVLTKYNYQNIKDFVTRTGLSVPQTVIVVDEFETVIRNLGKRLNDFVKLIQNIVAMGRNTGYHLILASQNLTSDVPAATYNNITVRAAMGCFEDMSTLVLGNNDAKNNMGLKGRLIINTQSQNKRKQDNVDVRVPFMPPEERADISQELRTLNKRTNFKRPLDFYDENTVVNENDFDKFLDKINAPLNSIVLGEPSFVTKDSYKVQRLIMEGDDIENICVLTQSVPNKIRYFRILEQNVKRIGAGSFVMCSDINLEKAGADKINERVYSKNNNFTNDWCVREAMSLTYSRILALQSDDLVFSGYESAPEHDTVFYNNYSKGSSMDTVLNRARFSALLSLMVSDSTIIEGLKLNVLKGNELNTRITELANKCMTMYDSYGCTQKKLTYSKLPPVFCWVLGMEKMIGLVRDVNNGMVGQFKKCLQDCTKVNVRFIMFTSTMEDITSLRSGIRWFIIDDVPSTELTKIKCDDFPNQVGPVLGVLFDLTSPGIKCTKFKKIELDGEILGG